MITHRFLFKALFTVNLLLLTGFFTKLYGQQPGTGLDTLRNRQNQQQDTSGVRVVPWEFNTIPTADTVSTDSLARWQLWLNWLDHKHRDRDVITYRLGRQGRTDAMIHQTHEPKHQKLYWEEISLNDPVSNSINWNMIPHFKISRITEQQEGIEHVTRFNVRQYYLNKPLTKLNYTEGKANFRSLNFLLTQNLGRKTNYELSFWDRRDGSELPRDDLNGTQIFARVFHTIDHKRSFKASFLLNDIDIDEPFGFRIPDLERFDFIFDNVASNVSNASSNTSAKNFQLNYYQRPDTTSPHNLQAAVFWNSRERDVDFSADTVGYQVSSLGGSIRKWLRLGSLNVNGAVRVENFRTDESGPEAILQKDHWTLGKASGSAVLSLGQSIELESSGDFTLRTDNEQGYSFSSKITLQLAEKLSIIADGSIGQHMPTIQEKYWQSNLFAGNENLESEDITRIGGTLEFQHNPNLKSGVRAEQKEIDKGIHLSADSVFANMSEYRARSLTVYSEWNTPSIELRGSVTWHSYDADERTEFTERLLRGEDRLFLKGGAYWKTYAFHRAAFVKMGFFGIYSPNQYLAATYQPVLDRWQNANNTQLIPSFYRVDLDVSARVRWIMFTLRFENLLDDVGQAGFFETAQYPLPNRRFLFGIKVRFRN